MTFSRNPTYRGLLLVIEDNGNSTSLELNEISLSARARTPWSQQQTPRWA